MEKAAFVLACFACEELEHARVISDLVFLVGDQCSGDQWSMALFASLKKKVKYCSG